MVKNHRLKRSVVTIFILTMCLLTVSCQNKEMLIELKDGYKGPCIIFISKNNDSLKSYKILIKENGLGAIYEGNMGACSFKYNNIDSFIPYIDFADLDQTNNSQLGIYGFGRTTEQIKSCTNDYDIDYLEFFVGTKSEYVNWKYRFGEAIKSFEDKGVDWCSFYKRVLKLEK